MPGRLGQGELLGPTGERVAAVPDPVRPGEQLLTPAALDDLVRAEPSTTSRPSTAYTAQRRAHLGDHRPLVAGRRSRTAHQSEDAHGLDFSASRSATIPGAAMSRTYQIRTHGCQMNVHDSERLAGLLEDGRLRAGRRRRRRTSWCSTPAPSGRTPTTGCTATSAICCRPRSATRGCRSPSAAAWPRRTRTSILQRAPWVDVVFGTHNIGSLPVLLERARIARRGPGRDRRVAGDLPVQPADAAGLRVRRLGLDQRRLQQHLHLLHRAGPARQGDRPAARRHPGRDRGAGRRGRAGGHAARPERERVRRRVRRSAGLRQAAPRLRRRSTGWSGSASPHRTPRTSPTT